MGRILGLDYGRRRIGVAVSDPLGLTAQPLETWVDLDWKEVGERVCTLVVDMGVEKVVVGFPLTLKGTRGRMTQEVERFAATLHRRIQIPVILWDERLTSIQAERFLQQVDEKPSRKKRKVDLIAAVLILQNYLDYLKGASEKDQGEKG